MGELYGLWWLFGVSRCCFIRISSSEGREFVMTYESCVVSQVLRHDSYLVYRISWVILKFGLIILSYSSSLFSGLVRQIQSVTGSLHCDAFG